MKNLFMKTRAATCLIALTVILFCGFSLSTANNPTIHISHYEFGKIIINEDVYTNDIVIWPDGSIKKGPEDMHSMSVSDFDELFRSDLKKLVIGTGDEGKAELDFRNKLKKALKKEEIELIMMDTHQLVLYLNGTTERDFLVFVHLNC